MTSRGLAAVLSAALLLTLSGVAGAQTPVAIDQSEDPAAVAPLAATAVAKPAASKISLTAGLTGFDNIGADNATQLSCLNSAGYTFDVIDALGTGWDTEYRAAANLGMSILLFQGFYQPFWSDPAQGTARGQLMVTNAQSVGYPKGAQVFLNLENNLTDGTSPITRAGMITWVKNWAATVRAAGYVPGVYVGVPQILTSADLENAVGKDGVFWRSASSSAPQTTRGYVMRQPKISAPACGTTIDVDASGTAANGAALVGAGFPRTPTPPSVPGAFGPLTPARILDTRIDGRGQIPAAGNRKVQILGAAGVPTSGVSAVVLNLTVTNTTTGGYLTAYPTGTAPPTASNVNFIAGQTVPNLVVVPVGADGTIQIYNSAATAVDAIADVAGYYLGGTPTSPGTLGALPPTRILDTRIDGRAAVQGQSGRAVTVTGRGGVPASGVSAVVLTITVTDTANSGYVTVFPTGINLPTASNLNFSAGQTVPNLVLVPVGTDGKVMLYNASSGPVDLLADVVGYVS